jgi:glycosyltransferase involved in cell wall biosynthesis
VHLVIHAWRELAHPQAGGSEQLVHQIATGMSERGHRVRLICGGPVGERAYAVTGAGGTYSQYLRMPLLDRRLARDADVVLDIANGATYCSPLWRRAPTLLLVHHVHTEQWAQMFPRPIATAGSWFERKVVPRIYRQSLVIAVSPSTAADLEGLGVPASRIRIVPNTVEAVPPGSPARSPEPMFVALGRLVPHKRIDLLLEIWERVRPAIGGRLVIIGDGPERSRLQALAGPSVDVLGRVDDEMKHRLLSEAWLLLHTASHEGWGIAITEAAAHGTPALAFDVSGVRDAVVTGRTGVLVDTLDDFVQQWVALVREPSVLTEYGAAARELAGALGTAHTVDRFEEVALEAIERRPGHSADGSTR